MTTIGAFNVANATMGDLAFSPAGQLYGSNTTSPNIDTVNLATGQATQVGGGSGLSGFSQGGGLAISLSGTIYGSPQNAFFGTFDPVTGAYTTMATLPTPAGSGTGYGAMAFNNSGVLYGANPSNGLPTHLVTINTSNGAINDLGPSVVGLDAIAFSPAVPEPGTMALVLAPAVLGLTRAVRRRK